MTAPSNPDPLPRLAIVEEVGAELHRLFLAAQEREAARGRRRVPGLGLGRHGARLALLAGVVVVGATAGALAATGLLSGTPVKTIPATHSAGSGVVLASSVRRLPLAVADPAGGLPWGLRFYRTSRGLGCLQYGRLNQGTLGVLGQDGMFDDDHRLHPLAPGASNDTAGCIPLDGHGNTYLAVVRQGVPTSAFVAGIAGQGGCVAPGKGHGRLVEGLHWCPAQDERALFYGALGPDAVSITYTNHHHLVTVPTVGAEGAYLIVTRAQPGASPQIWGPGSPNASTILPLGTDQPIRRITYRNGTVCHINAHTDRTNHGRPCGPVGYAISPAVAPTPAKVRAPLTVTVGRHLKGLPRDFPHVVFVTFKAPVAITGASAVYGMQTTLACHHGGETEGGNLDRDVRAGQRVTLTFGTSGGPPGSAPCRGTYTGRVYYANTTGNYTSQRYLPTALTRARNLTVGTFTIHLP